MSDLNLAEMIFIECDLVNFLIRNFNNCCCLLSLNNNSMEIWRMVG